jgi:ATP-dependent Lhr-like helicase
VPDPDREDGAAAPKDERRGGRRPSRVAGAYVVSRDGEPRLYVERGGKGLLRLARMDEVELAAALVALTEAAAEGVVPKLGIERVDGEPVIGSEVESVLVEAGFSRQPKRLVASA